MSSPEPSIERTGLPHAGHVVLRLSVAVLWRGAVAVLLSIPTTILLLPFWSWFEAYSGIESVGHSGPAAWCYAAVFLIIAAALALLVLFRRRVTESRTDAA
jgi:hypothetical protein